MKRVKLDLKLVTLLNDFCWDKVCGNTTLLKKIEFKRGQKNKIEDKFLWETFTTTRLSYAIFFLLQFISKKIIEKKVNGKDQPILTQQLQSRGFSSFGVSRTVIGWFQTSPLCTFQKTCIVFSRMWKRHFFFLCCDVYEALFSDR